jgi:hypothetical protein
LHSLQSNLPDTYTLPMVPSCRSRSSWNPGLSLISNAIAFVCATSVVFAQNQPQLEAHTAGHQTTFRIGERIPLDLNFTGPDDGSFQVGNETYDRSGRRDYVEKFEVEPTQGWADPLATFFVRDRPHIGGGISAPPEKLSSTPHLLTRNLNEWVRFDQPGDYTITIVSQRTGPIPRPAHQEHGNPWIKSNPIHLHIIAATSEWQAQRLASIRVELAKPGGDFPAQQWQDALADLRFLGTPAAIDYMAQNLRDDRLWICPESALGLAGVPRDLRPYALTALRRELQDPDFPISSWYFAAALSLQREADGSVEEADRIDAASYLAILSSLPGKNAEARSSTAKMLHADSGMIEKLTPAEKAQLIVALPPPVDVH